MNVSAIIHHVVSFYSTLHLFIYVSIYLFIDEFID